MSEPWIGDRVLYLKASGSLFSMQGAEFAIGGTLEIVDLIPRSPWVNHGTASSPILERQPCTDWAFDEVVAELIVRDPDGSGGQLCFEGSVQSGRVCSRYCVDWEAWLYTPGWGFSSAGTPSCPLQPSADCETLAVEPVSWGRIRADYRSR